MIAAISIAPYLTDKGEHKLQALVYDILPLEEGAGKRCSECGVSTGILSASNDKDLNNPATLAVAFALA